MKTKTILFFFLIASIVIFAQTPSRVDATAADGAAGAAAGAAAAGAAGAVAGGAAGAVAGGAAGAVAGAAAGGAAGAAAAGAAGGLDPALQAAQAAPKIIKVSAEGGEFKTVTDAVKSIPEKNTVRTIIHLAPGVYKEKVLIPPFKPFVTLYGDPTNKPTITFDGTAAKFGTIESATVAVESDYFMAANIIFENTAPEPPPTVSNGQAVAFRISGEKAAIYNCRFLSFQDTLCDHKGTHYFSDCYVEGTVDFVFGRAKSLYENTELHSKSKAISWITAHARQQEEDDSGFAFVHCKVTGTGDIFLGRAWMAKARTVFAYTTMATNVNPAGWANTNNNPPTFFLGEYNCDGPGANTLKRAPYAKILTEPEAKPFLDKGFINAATWLLPPPKL